MSGSNVDEACMTEETGAAIYVDTDTSAEAQKLISFDDPSYDFSLRKTVYGYSPMATMTDIQEINTAIPQLMTPVEGDVGSCDGWVWDSGCDALMAQIHGAVRLAQNPAQNSEAALLSWVDSNADVRAFDAEKAAASGLGSYNDDQAFAGLLKIYKDKRDLLFGAQPEMSEVDQLLDPNRIVLPSVMPDEADTYAAAIYSIGNMALGNGPHATEARDFVINRLLEERPYELGYQGYSENLTAILSAEGSEESLTALAQAAFTNKFYWTRNDCFNALEQHPESSVARAALNYAQRLGWYEPVKSSFGDSYRDTPHEFNRFFDRYCPNYYNPEIEDRRCYEAIGKMPEIDFERVYETSYSGK